MSSYQPKDFIETAEGLIFAVVTDEPEERRILSSLRYQRMADGYGKLNTRDADKLLRDHFPHYCYFSSTRDVWLHGVPEDRVVKHHQPRLRLQEIIGRAPNDEIEGKLQRLISLFKVNEVAIGDLGITGSLLIGAQNPGSDIDLVFYQRESFFKAREVIRTLTATGRLDALGERLWQDAYARRGCALSYDEYYRHEQRKHNKGAIEQTKFDISLMTSERWQDQIRYRKLGRVHLQTTVVDDRSSFDYPSRYRISHPSVKEVISYTATYSGQAISGEQVEIQGQLEVSIAGDLRIIIGTNREAQHEYIKAHSG